MAELNPGIEASMAPVARTSTNGAALVLGSGIATTIIALGLVFGLKSIGFNPMGWYINAIIPVGALFVGLIASSGYGIASWKLGFKISGGLLWTMVALLALGYFVTQYLGFRLALPDGATVDDGTSIDFWTWYDEATRSIAFKRHGKMGDELGLLGYGVRALELFGFVGGGAIVPATLRGHAYCEPCQRYKHNRRVGFIPASLPSTITVTAAASAKKQADTQAVETSSREALEAIVAAAKDPQDTRRLPNELRKRARLSGASNAHQLPRTFSAHLISCDRCFDGSFSVQSHNGTGQNRSTSTVFETPVSPEIVRNIIRATSTS